jgi:hypothetical protein
MMPRGYRVAYMDHMTRTDALYPIGIHLVVRFFRRLNEWSYHYRPSAMEKMVSKAVCNARWETQRECNREAASRCSQCAYPHNALDKMRALLQSKPYTPEATE